MDEGMKCENFVKLLEVILFVIQMKTHFYSIIEIPFHRFHIHFHFLC